jgi:hypothetical protein
MNLDIDNILRRGDTTDPDIEEFVAGIHNIEQEVRKRMELTRQWMERDADKRRRDMPTSLHPGAYAYLSTNAALAVESHFLGTRSAAVKSFAS